MHFGHFRNLEQKFQSGKYKGLTLGQVWAEHPYYIGWLLSNIPNFTISNEAFEEQIRRFPEKKYSLLRQQKRMNEDINLEDKFRKREQAEWLDTRDQEIEAEYNRADTYYALGGDDYDSWKEEGGDLDSMMDGMGF